MTTLGHGAGAAAQGTTTGLPFPGLRSGTDGVPGLADGE